MYSISCSKKTYSTYIQYTYFILYAVQKYSTDIIKYRNTVHTNSTVHKCSAYIQYRHIVYTNSTDNGHSRYSKNCNGSRAITI